MTDTYQEIPIKSLTPNPLNPRKVFSGLKFDELVESVKAKGVLLPILVRPLNGNGTFEIIAGERRYRASIAAGLETIPARVKNLSDEDAFDVMTIENLQREDLNEYEEASCFAAYTKKRGEKSVADLAARVGIDARYIQRRIKVLDLPKKVLAAWQDGKILYGHCEQLMRISDKKEILNHLNIIIRNPDFTVSRLKIKIDEDSPEMKIALFDTKPCKSCTQNTSVQGKLFGDDFKAQKVLCTNPTCFKKKQNDWLLANWKESETGKKYKTNGFRFEGAELRNQYAGIYGDTNKKCFDCDKFITIIDLSGKASWSNVSRGCLDIACYGSTYNKKSGKDSAPVMKNHGPEFQDRFYRHRIPVVVNELPWDNPGVQRITLLALLDNWSKRTAFLEEVEGKKHCSVLTSDVWPTLEKLSLEELQKWIRKTALQHTINYGESFAQSEIAVLEKHMIAGHFEVSLAREWTLHEEYLKRKTIPEILKICKDLKIFDDPKVKEYARATLKMKNDKYDSLKKKDLIRLILESGIDLVGKVPAEILKVK